MTVDHQTLKTSITAAEREVDIAERHLKNKQLALQFLQNQLRDLIIADVKGLKITTKEVSPVITNKPTEPEDESARKERVRRRWRVLGMKIKFGLGAQAMALKQRNLKDASSFIDKDTEVNTALVLQCIDNFIQEASKEDQLDLEGKCARKTRDKRYFRRGGVCVGTTQGRDNF